MTVKVITKSNFLVGAIAEATVKHALEDLNYRFAKRGCEDSLSYLVNDLRKKHIYGSDSESKKTMDFLRKEPDFIAVAPSGGVSQWEIKFRSKMPKSFEDFLKIEYENEEVKRIFSNYPACRIVYLCHNDRTIRSISGLEPLTQYHQYSSWFEPWSWIEGLLDKDHSDRFIEEAVFTPLNFSGQRIGGQNDI
jgi:hypothetical protein